jgi:hypothetical protein
MSWQVMSMLPSRQGKGNCKKEDTMIWIGLDSACIFFGSS